MRLPVFVHVRSCANVGLFLHCARPYLITPTLCHVCVRFPPPRCPRDVRHIGVELIGHQRRIVSSIQTLRLQLLHEHDQGFHV